MRSGRLRAVLGGVVAVALSCGRVLQSEAPRGTYPAMAPLPQYLMASSAEIELARSAAPKSISGDADVLVLGGGGFHLAVKGSNGWACLVQRSWNAAVDFPEFWNPKIRAPICFNPAAVRTVLPVVIFWTKMVLNGEQKAQMGADAKAAFKDMKLPSLGSGAMSFMMSKDQYLTDDNPSFHPHVMLFEPIGEGPKWGANLPGSPVFAGEDKVNGMTIIPVPVPRWSDGSLDPVPAK